MTKQFIVITLLALMTLSGGVQTQGMTYRIRGIVKDDAGAAVKGAKVHAEAIRGFRGEPFGGQREFTVNTNDKGEFTLAGISPGMWVFEASAADLVPAVIVLPVQFVNRQAPPISWQLPLVLRRPTNDTLVKAASAATAGKAEDAVKGLATLGGETNMETLCGAGEVALFARQQGLAGGIFQHALKVDAKAPCALIGMASSALMRNDMDTAVKMLWDARNLAPQGQRQALGTAIKDLQQITGTKQ